MKQLVLLSLLIFDLTGCALPKQHGADPHDLSRFSGEYSYNFSCTDEDAHVHVRIYKKRDPNGHDEWRADGEMLDHTAGREVSFKDAYVIEEEDGSVTISTQFVDFKIKGTELIWLPAYDQNLTKQ